MPTVDFSLKDLSELVGKKLDIKELDCLLEFAKAELESYDETSGMLTLSLGDTNLPYLWSVEGLARLLKGVLGFEKGVPELKLQKSSHTIVVDKNISDVRPFIAAFTAKGRKVDEAFLKQIIQFQEKLCDSFGRKRKKLAVGIYPYAGITFPVYYRAVVPESIRFIPLDFRTEMSLAEILKVHPAGQKFAFTLEGLKDYPILVDAKNNVLSFPPIINSQQFGKVTLDSEELFIEATGEDFATVNLACTILAYIFSDRGFQVAGVEIKYPEKKIVTPQLSVEKIKIREHDVNSLLGTSLGKLEIKRLLEKARYNVKDYVVSIPPYRADILHAVDVVEDIGIMFGFKNIPTSPLTSYTVGDVSPKVVLIDKFRDVLVGFGFQELMSPMLSNKGLIYDKMNIHDSGTVEIRSFMSASYSVVRSWIMPHLLEVLSKNKHNPYPQNIFEQGLVTKRLRDKISDSDVIAVACCSAEVDYTKIKQVADALMGIGHIDYSIKEVEHGSFIPGRVAGIFIKDRQIACLGEVSPDVLGNFDINMPVAMMEFDISALYSILYEKTLISL